MSLPPSSSASYLQSSIDHPPSQRENFRKFFECWLLEQNQYLQQLNAASKNGCHDLHPLIERVVQHYEHYYRAKSWWSDSDVLAMLTPSWRSSLEDAFLWIGGWRPSMAFHLLYSKSGLQLEAGLNDLLCGLTRDDLSDFSASQLTRVNELQKKTVEEEREITEKMAKQQESVADTSMVELSHLASEFMGNNSVASASSNGHAHSNGGGEEMRVRERVKSTLGSKEEGLRGMLQRADALRLKTLRGVVEILSPIQAVHFLIAAAELHLRLHDWGKQRDGFMDHNHLS